MQAPVLTFPGQVQWSFCIYEDDSRTHHWYTRRVMDGKVWIGKLEVTKEDERLTPEGFQEDLSLEQYNTGMRPIDASKVYPEKTENTRVATGPSPETHVKRARGMDSVLENDKNAEWTKALLLHEISILEKIPPHPNIIKYLGCLLSENFIVGIVFERLENTLAQARTEISDYPTFLAEVQSAVDHVHGLELAHNDINPYNIMIKDGRPILIDFGACASFGERTQFGGTHGWREEMTYVSDKQHDIYAMKRLREWFENDGKLSDIEPKNDKVNDGKQEDGKQEDGKQEDGKQEDGNLPKNANPVSPP